MIDGGRALLVEIEGPGAPPTVTPLATGDYIWITLSQQINTREDVDFLASKLRVASEDLNENIRIGL